MSLSRIQYTRTVYSYLDFLRDIGGLNSAIGPLFGVIIAIVQYRSTYVLLTSEMLPPVDEEGKATKKNDTSRVQIKYHICRIPIYLVQLLCRSRYPMKKKDRIIYQSYK